MGNRRRNGRKKGTQNDIPSPLTKREDKRKKNKMERKPKEEVIDCYICGDRGFLNALIDCSQCSSMAAHQYCLGIPPGSVIEDTITWSCDYCFAPTESKSCILSKTQIIVVKDEPQPLQTLPPISYDRSSEQTEPSNEPENAERTQKTSFTSMVGKTTFTYPLEFQEGISETAFVGTSIINFTIEETVHECSIEETVELDDEPSVGNDEEIDDFHITTGNVDLAKSGEYTKLDSVDITKIEDMVRVVNEASSEVYVLNQEVPMEHQLDAVEESEEPSCSSAVMSMQQKVRSTIYGSGVRKSDHPSEVTIPSSAVNTEGEFHECSSKEVITQVGLYKITSDLAPILKNIINKQGDIFRDCLIKSDDSFLVNICEVIQELQTVSLQCLQHQHVERLRNALKLLEDSGADVKWLNGHCDILERAVHQLIRYNDLKQEVAQCLQNLQLRKERLDLKRANASELLQEIMIQEGEIKSSKEHSEQLECRIEEIKSLCRYFLGKSLADGLY